MLVARLLRRQRRGSGNAARFQSPFLSGVDVSPGGSEETDVSGLENVVGAVDRAQTRSVVQGSGNL